MPENQNPEQSTEIHLFTDGGCSGNPGPGGWGFILRSLATGKEIERSGGSPHTTNNQMELEAVIQGLCTLTSSCKVKIFTDSTYVGKGISEWLPGWKARDWQRREGNRLVPIKNQEHWQRLDQELERHEVTYIKVKGHSDHPENDRADELAVAAYQKYL